MIAQVCDLKLGEFIHTFGDAHIYNNHMTQIDELLSREPKELPLLSINPDIKDIFQFTINDFVLSGYDPHPFIKAPISV